MKALPLLLLALLTVGTTIVRADENPWRFEFTDKAAVKSWRIVNDGVMGGKSTSQVSVTEDGHLKFRGTLSLANNGGFASVRLSPQQLNLKPGQTIVLRVKGDGRKYTFNLYTPERRTAYSFQQDFPTKANEWIEVELPLDKFVAHWFGRPRKADQLDPEKVNSIGILLGDKKAGPFELLVDSIRIKTVDR
ncbi:MAG: CIA30 family protein [Pirellulaceae bacterium]|nr:CIA30 family protein [Pirellulaceae bacterium]